MIRLSIFIFLIFGVFSNATVVIQSDKKVITDTPDDSSVHLLYIKDTAGLLQVASSNYGITGDFSQGTDGIAVDYHYPRNLIFWSTSKGEIFSSPLQESRSLGHVDDAKLLYKESRWYPESIAVDYINDRLYVLDTKSNTVRLLNLKGGEQIVINVSRRNYRPKQLEIDPEKGYLFLLDEGEPTSGRYAHVLRMKLDGSQPKVIDPPPVNLELITGAMTLDRLRSRVLLSSRSQRKIIAADYDGKLLDTVIEQQNGTFGMSITADELFWINAAYYNNGVAFTDGSVYKCNLDKKSGRCLSNSTRKLYESFGTSYIRAVRAITPLPINENWQMSKCNSKCEQMCLDSSCRCNIGYSGSEQCKTVDEFIIYEDNKVIRSICLPNEENNCQAFIPFQAGLRLRKKERTGFDYDSLARQLYYGGKNAIYRADLNTGNSSILLYQRAVFFGPMALDWMSKILYYTEIEQRGNVSFYILKALSARPDIDAEKSSSMLWELGKIHTMATCPWQGYLFMTVFHNSEKRFQMRRINTDGTNMTILLGLNDATFFSIDHMNQKLYTINNVTSMLVRSNFNGREIENLTLIENVGDVTGFIANDEQFIYLKYRSRMLKLDKQSGKLIGEINLEPYDSDMTMNLKLHNPKIFYIYDKNPCTINNGECDNFCFALKEKNNSSNLKKICRCFDGVRCYGDTRSGMDLAEIIKNKM